MDDKAWNLLRVSDTGVEWDESLLMSGANKKAGWSVGHLTSPALQALPLPSVTLQQTMILLETGGKEITLGAGMLLRHLTRIEGREEMRDEASRAMAGLQDDYMSVVRCLHVPEQLSAFTEQLGRAATLGDVHAVLATYSTLLVGGYHSLVAKSGADQSLSDTGHPPQNFLGFSPDLRLSLPPLTRFSEPGLLTRAEFQSDPEGTLSGLAPLFEHLSASSVAYTPFMGNHLLLVVERREERVFQPLDWSLLRTLTRTAEAFAGQIVLASKVADLSLTDPETGLANDRKSSLLLEHWLAAAERGKGLAILVVDLAETARTKEQGLRTIAEQLSSITRGTDLVARHEGQEGQFLIILPGGSEWETNALDLRIRRHLAGLGLGEVDVGSAEFGPETRSIEDMLEVAYCSLRKSKRRRA